MDQQNSKLWGRLWRMERQTSGLTQQDVAQQMGCTPEYISLVERGARLGSAKFRNKLAALYGTTLNEMSAILKNNSRLLPAEQRLLWVLRSKFSGEELDRACELAAVYLETLEKYIDDLIEKQ